MSVINKLKSHLIKTRNAFTNKIKYIFADKSEINNDFFEELLSTLIQADVSVKLSEEIINNTKRKIKEKLITKKDDVKKLLKEELISILSKNYTKLNFEKDGLYVILIVGVNGSGKTTSIAKLANNLRKNGKKIILAAADTFRAGAIEQIELWARKIDVDIIKHKDGSDPAAVVYDAISAARSRNKDILIVDTAGRLHTKTNLMEELKKIKRVIQKQIDEKYIETFIVLDATTGQNALQQAKLFKDAVNLTGIILTKLDGTAKGGIVITISEELSLPVRFIGVGENIDDLVDFDPEAFTEALLE